MMLAGTEASAQPRTAPQPEFYEFRTYHLVRGPSQARLANYLQEAFIPTAARLGIGPIGVFSVEIGIGRAALHVLIPHPSAESALTLQARLSADTGYAAAAEPFLGATPLAPPYASLDVKLMRAFPLFPKMELPAARSPRIFELRNYRSPSERTGMKKIEMFERLGEIEIFRKTGLTPVMFAQDLTGPTLPSLTYMLTFPDLATRERNWAAFRSHPEWRELSAKPGYTDPDIVKDTDSQILNPTAYSQI